MVIEQEPLHVFSESPWSCSSNGLCLYVSSLGESPLEAEFQGCDHTITLLQQV